MLKKILSLVVLGAITVSCGSTKVTVNNETIELEDGIYEVELVNGLELEFDINGNFLSVEMDD